MKQLVPFFLLCLLLGAARAHGEPIQAVTYEWPPYNYRENGEITGLSKEVVEAVLARAGLRSSFGIYPWPRAVMMAKTKKNVLIYTLRRIPERESLYKWVGPITPPASSYLYRLKRRNDIVIESLDDTRRYVIGVVKGDSMHQHLLSRGFLEGRNLDVVSKEVLNLKKLFRGRIDLVVWTELTLPLKASAAGLCYNQLEKALVLWRDGEGYYSAFSRQTPDAVVERARIALEQIRAEGFIRSAAAKYLKKVERLER